MEASGTISNEAHASAARIRDEFPRWLVLFLVPTLAFKFFYLTVLYGKTGEALRFGLFTILDSAGAGASFAGRALVLGRLMCIDVLEVTLLCSALFLVSWRLRPRSRSFVLAGALGIALFLTYLNAVSVRQLGALLTGETLAIAFEWTRAHPAVLEDFLSGPKLGALVVALAWTALPFAVERIETRRPGVRFGLRRLAPWMLSLLGAAAVLGLFARLGMTHNAPRAFGGYWSSTWAALRNGDDAGPCAESLPNGGDLRSEYQGLVFPDRLDPAPRPIVELPRAERRPRHVVIVALETAPRKYYPLGYDPGLPTFQRMAATGVVADRHYTPVPFTNTAIFSIVSGLYPRSGKALQQFGEFDSDSLASVLGERGYETSYIDSYFIDWRADSENRRMWRNLGFRRLVEREDREPRPKDRAFDAHAEDERRTFATILDAVKSADHHGRKAFVLAATAMGHYEWKHRAADHDLPAAAKLHRIAEYFDGLFAELLAGLEASGLARDVLIVVTGDHGLRYGAEFASLDEPADHGDTEFNVPFLLYAPGLIDRTVTVPYLTSHIDIAPTVLALLGLDDRARWFHGMDMLDARLADRTTFVTNAQLAPVGGLYREGVHYTVHHLTGSVARRVDAAEPDPGAPLADAAVRDDFAEAERLIDATSCELLRRGEARAAVAHPGDAGPPRGD